MFSDDDDRPLVAKSDLIGYDDHVPINVNGHVDSSGDQESRMSEDEDDDMPLVRSVFRGSLACVWSHIKLWLLSRRQQALGRSR